MLTKIFHDRIFFTRNGTTEENLNLDPVLVYQGTNRFNSRIDAGTASSKICKAKAIPDSLKPALEKLDAQVTVGKNIHIYYKGAETIDGFSRFCHVFYENDDLYVNEFQKTSRGSKYSSLFLILRDELLTARFTLLKFEDSIRFLIPSVRILDFVEIVNQISKRHERGEFELYVEDYGEKVEKFGWFNRVYYKEKSDDTFEEELMEDNMAIDAFDGLVKIQNFGTENEVKNKKDAIRKIKLILKSVL